jgi:hypothetical protein
MSNQHPIVDVEENVAREGQAAVDRFVQELQARWDRHDAEISTGFAEYSYERLK